jgi:alpha-beta hydrolase superfamily lysophospholipase
MDETSEWLESGDGIRLFVRRWTPPGSPSAVVHIVHGMAEHSLRYARLAGRLCDRGFAVWAADQRGHGKTADSAVNDPRRGGLLGHCADRDGFFRVVADIDVINAAIGEKYPGLPLFLLGHSWGSFISQAYIEKYGSRLAGCILSGTRGPGGPELTLGAPFLSLIAALKGSRRGSVLAHAMADGPYNKPFRPNRTPFDWLSRDEKEVDAYIADPLCGNLCSVGFYRDMVRAFTKIHTQEAMKGIPRDLPVYIFCGSADPVGAMGQSPTALMNAYRSLGIRDLELVLYPDARHETLNETNREEVMGNLLSWLKRHCRSGSAKTAE